MSEQLYGYTIHYVQRYWLIDHDNYNNLVGAITAFVNIFLGVFEQAIEFLDVPELKDYYQNYSDIANQYKKNVEEGRYMAGYKTPVYAHHYQDLAEILKASASELNNILDCIKETGASIPTDVTIALNDAIKILEEYPRLMPNIVIEPEHHNDILRALKLLHIVLSWLSSFFARTAILTILSEPITEVRFLLDGYINKTPFQQELPKGEYTITMPRVVVVDDEPYRFVKWHDGPTSRIRTIQLIEDTILIAQYELFEPFEPLGIAGASYGPPEG